MFDCPEMQSFQALIQEVAEANDDDMGCLLSLTMRACPEVFVKHVGVSSIVVESVLYGTETLILRGVDKDNQVNYLLFQENSTGRAYLRAGLLSIGEVLELLEREG